MRSAISRTAGPRGLDKVVTSAFGFAPRQPALSQLSAQAAKAHRIVVSPIAKLLSSAFERHGLLIDG